MIEEHNSDGKFSIVALSRHNKCISCLDSVGVRLWV